MIFLRKISLCSRLRYSVRSPNGQIQLQNPLFSSKPVARAIDKMIVTVQPPPPIFLYLDWGGSDTFSTKGYRLSDILPRILIAQPACFNDT